MYTYSFIYITKCIYIYIQTYIRTHQEASLHSTSLRSLCFTQVPVLLYSKFCVCVCVNVFVCLYIHICIHLCIYMHIHICIYIHINVYIYIYIYTHIEYACIQQNFFRNKLPHSILLHQLPAPVKSLCSQSHCQISQICLTYRLVQMLKIFGGRSDAPGSDPPHTIVQYWFYYSTCSSC